MRTFAALATIGLCGLVAGCSSDSNTRCSTDAQCGSGRVCDTGFCKAALVRTIGEVCASDADCSVGSSCAAAMPGGLCTFACAGDQCPSGAVCVDLRASGSGLLCATACTDPSQCRSGYTCCPGFGACVPSANCPAQSRPASATLGIACTSNAQCTGPGEICVGAGSAPNPEFPGGACTAACNPADPTTCPSNSSCVSTSTGSFCFASCSGTGSCAVNAQLSCTSNLCRSSTASPSCNPTGTAPTPVNGGTVNPPNDPGCLRTLQNVRTLPTIATLGQQKVGNTVTFTVPPGTGTISILSQGIQASDVTVPGGTQPPDTVMFDGNVLPNSVVPSLLKDPTQALLYDDDPVSGFPADPSVLNVFYGGSSAWAGMMTVPNASPLLAHAALQGSLTPGQWQFLVNDFALECTNPQHTSTNECAGTGVTTSTYDIQVLAKPGVAPATGTIDVAFYTVSGTAANLIANPNFIRMTQGLANLYADVGLCIGKITVYDLPGWAQTKYGGLIDVGDGSFCSDLNQLFTLAVDGTQVNFFLVNGFSDNANPLNTIGIDGTIPGPSSVGGTINSGAAVSMADLDDPTNCSPSSFSVFCGRDRVAYTAAHEGGHFLGLYHTSERHGDAFDPLSDTKKCPCDKCAQPLSARNNCTTVNPLGPGTLMQNSFCVSQSTTPECGGGDNLMFWLVGPESVGALSPQQGQVMRANPVVR
jgi:hypothetical protein